MLCSTEHGLRPVTWIRLLVSDVDVRWGGGPSPDIRSAEHEHHEETHEHNR